MNYFRYSGDTLACEDVGIEQLAQKYGTPLYVYSLGTIKRHYRVFDRAFEGIDHLVCYAIKANPTLALVYLLAKMGAGADIVSRGELLLALKAGIPAERIVFSGVGKTPEEIKDALEVGILMFNVESLSELEVIADVAGRLGKKAPVSFRVNPDVDPKTHPYVATGLKTSKFGIPMGSALEAYKRAMELPSLEIVGIDCHIGSQLINLGPIKEAMLRLKALLNELKAFGAKLRYLDVGGGLGIRYDQEEPPEPSTYAETIQAALRGIESKESAKQTLILEPGRVIVGNAGILVTRVLYTKSQEGKRFVVVDAGMNDLIRPALYGSFQRIEKVKKTGAPVQKADIVGPVCESGDFFAKDREIEGVKEGDLLAIFGAGAYGIAMASNYNMRPKPAQVGVLGKGEALLSKRQTLEELIQDEAVPMALLEEKEGVQP
jgi:diaminopimelate decarboxylase